jgi:hypothetical protein
MGVESRNAAAMTAKTQAPFSQIMSVKAVIRAKATIANMAKDMTNNAVIFTLPFWDPRVPILGTVYIKNKFCSKSRTWDLTLLGFEIASFRLPAALSPLLSPTIHN